jgi:hypothetical protein
VCDSQVPDGRTDAVTKGYPDFLTTHWKHLLFGMLLMAMSGFGRTFFISVFGADPRVTRLIDFSVSLSTQAALCLAYTSRPWR